MENKPAPIMEFHVSRNARDKYQFDQSLFTLSGNVVFANFHAARLFTQKMNQKRDLLNFPEQAVKAGQINAMGMIDEILHYVIGLYRHQVDPQVLEKLLASLEEELGRDQVDRTLMTFADEFPPLSVYRHEISLDDYLVGTTGGVSNRQILFEEMLVLWLENSNPAMAPYTELFDQSRLVKETQYSKIIDLTREFFEEQPHFGPDHQNLVDMLRSPAVAVPYSLSGQLEYIRERWGSLLGQFLYRLLGSLDLIKEEERAVFGGGPGPIGVPVYRGTGLEFEAERFSPDREWMPTLVLIAKNSFVWLDQLSKKYQRPIHRLDQIPDEELDTLTHRGISGLWLIGLWERSEASARIKQLTGNPEAVASAYSLAGYAISHDLGGQEAFQNLRDRAWQRGIRLASDMVPNHMGIDSQWVMEHPNWFISLDYSPFPSYSFNGPDLSKDNRVRIDLEDHYYSRSDAAVVFKRVDRWTGSEKYIYHGNDGTSMPWNDTAQLNYLVAEVREAVIQTILHVARQFPIIRFDAAMTLTKKHFQRLWYPEPGTGGDIPSRSDYGMTKEQFDDLMPEEFWREVVDRVAREVPDTLLLAEAFWLMEGYFVRTLGMHRVYNSAFMNLLRNEDNAKYRSILKNTLEFDPEIMKRFVNFMNNPDERTAVDQFGKGDKYFGVCTLLATLPGLPMIGHGQIEGFSEKYGMEFRRAYWDETPDEALIQRHEREIFPLLHRRRQFAGVDNFLLYDFFTPEGTVNEDVYAYSNGVDGQHSLVIYHNKFARTAGWIRVSAAYSARTGHGGTRQLVQRTLGEALGLHARDTFFSIFRDASSNLEYIRSSQELVEKGLYVELEAYKYHTFLDFREIQDNERRQYRRVCEYLGGRGVPNIDEAIQQLFLQPIHDPFNELVNAGMFRRLMDDRVNPNQKPVQPPDQALLDEVEIKELNLLQAIRARVGGRGDPTLLARENRSQLEVLLWIPALQYRYPLPSSGGKYQEAIEYLQENLEDDPAQWVTLLGWMFVHNLGKIVTDEGFEEYSRAWLDEWLFGRLIAATARDFGLDDQAAQEVVNTIRILTSQQCWYTRQKQEQPFQILENWLEQGEIQKFLGINRYKDILWYNKESFDRLLWWMMLLSVIQIAGDPNQSSVQIVEQFITCFELIERFKEAEENSGYQVRRLLGSLIETAAI
ncbi:MAG TPA: alpha-amylase family glycosyl hydrolase [Anaerolineaceae bacterium]|nr:alpha-amylase family glycosyl hydrolase [Anaerolineaceae bacterium]